MSKNVRGVNAFSSFEGSPSHYDVTCLFGCPGKMNTNPKGQTEFPSLLDSLGWLGWRVSPGRQFHDLTGHGPMPGLWALGKHQCRWNYMTEKARGLLSAGKGGPPSCCVHAHCFSCAESFEDENFEAKLQDVATVDSMYDKYDIPYDTIWPLSKQMRRVSKDIWQTGSASACN